MGSVLNFFDQTVSLETVAVLIVLVYIVYDIKHIKEQLGNHITDTNKKIDKLDAKIENKTDKLEAGQKQFEKELRSGQAKIEQKLDQLLKKS